MPLTIFRSAPLAMIAVLVVVKLCFLVSIGPVFTPDSGDYARFADLIVGGGEWVNHLDLKAELISLTAFRAIGYPAFLALCKLLAGDAWAWLAVAAQMALSVFTTTRLYVFARTLTDRPLLAVLAAGGHAIAQAFYLDQCILTDSLNASIVLLAATITAQGILRRCPPTLWDAMLFGCLLLAAFTMREAGMILQITLWPLLAFRCLATGANLGRTALVVAVAALPVFAGVQIYKSWNQMRTGERFVTTGGQTALFRPALDLYRRGIPVFREDPLLGDASALDGPTFETPGQAFAQINGHLAQTHNMTPLSIARYGQSMYLRHWLNYPVERAQILLSKFDRAIAYMLIMPVVAPERLILWSGDRTPLPTSSELRRTILDEGRLDLAAALALRTLARVLSAVVMTAFFLFVPIVFLRALKTAAGRPAAMSSGIVAMGGLWLFALGYFIAYGAVHLEERYLMPVTPFVFICGLAMIASSFSRAVAFWKTISSKGGHDV
ncbi:MAG TPA: hypothetical protein DC046_12970 [Rhodospirillaceae bacterium]|nr:hypothetical protein [Rhodospirillaceae bacterium]